MTSSILDILHSEFAVCSQHCTVALQVSDDATRPMLSGMFYQTSD